jgi:uncharacterized membrane protein
MSYPIVLSLHILSMVLLFGTGLGSAFYKWMGDLSGNVEHIAVVNRHVVLADWLFTTPTVIFQPLSGLYLLHIMGIPLSSSWVVLTFVLYALAGLCWLPVVWLQIRMAKLARDAVEADAPLPDHYWRYARIWFWLGWPAFISMVVLVFLMVGKYHIGAFA